MADRRASEVKQEAQEHVDSAAEQTQEHVDSAAEQSQKLMDKIKAQAHDVGERLKVKADDPCVTPKQAAIGAAAVGAAVAAVATSVAVHHKVSKTVKDGVIDKATEAGEGISRTVGTKAREGKQKVKSTADEAMSSSSRSESDNGSKGGAVKCTKKKSAKVGKVLGGAIATGLGVAAIGIAATSLDSKNEVEGDAPAGGEQGVPLLEEGTENRERSAEPGLMAKLSDKAKKAKKKVSGSQKQKTGAEGEEGNASTSSGTSSSSSSEDEGMDKTKGGGKGLMAKMSDKAQKVKGKLTSKKETKDQIEETATQDKGQVDSDWVPVPESTQQSAYEQPTSAQQSAYDRNFGPMKIDKKEDKVPSTGNTMSQKVLPGSNNKVGEHPVQERAPMFSAGAVNDDALRRGDSL